MEAKDDGGPAFPKVGSVDPRGEYEWAADGMSLRDYFATKAMCGLIASDEGSCKVNPEAARTRELIAVASYDMADAMLTARKA